MHPFPTGHVGAYTAPPFLTTTALSPCCTFRSLESLKQARSQFSFPGDFPYGLPSPFAQEFGRVAMTTRPWRAQLQHPAHTALQVQVGACGVAGAGGRRTWVQFEGALHLQHVGFPAALLLCVAFFRLHS